MKRFIVVLSLSLGMLFVAPAPEAAAWGGRSGSTDGGGHHSGSYSRHRRHRTHRRTASHGVPELDPGAAGSALVLLFGGIAYIASRRRDDSLA